MKVQFISDTHLEFRRSDSAVADCVPPVVAPVLVLAGDIGNPRHPRYAQFLELCGQGRERLFVVAGNHECYGSSYEETLALLRSICAAVQSAPTTLLERFRVHEHGGVRFLGDTLWSEIDERPEVWQCINDYRLIKGLTPAATRGIYAEACADLASALREIAQDPRPLPAVVVTHHAPARVMNGKFAGGAFDSAFYSDMERFCVPPVRAWISGHTHQSVRAKLGPGGVLSVSNCVGYPGEPGTGYDLTAFVDV